MSLSIAEWILKRRARRNSEQFLHGYDWAAGQLLRGVATERIEEQIVNDDFPASLFDNGARAALRTWERLVVNLAPPVRRR
jgi:hypothetical protein